MNVSGSDAGSLFEDLQFCWPWRLYQERLLRTVEQHLEDRRLHVVAAPGAGKTTLGLEVLRRLGRPALVLAPTLAIREQWIRRLSDFLPEGAREPEWVSRDLMAPSVLTVVTYQALHAKARRSGGASDSDREVGGEYARTDGETPPDEAELVEVISRLRSAGVATLVFDEAHHLRQEWWKVLSRLADALPDSTLVSLTATPPYDTTGHGWRRYEELCGPIDDEISVPELVKAGTLCPHQDFVRVVVPGPEVDQTLRDHDRAVSELVSDLIDSPEFSGRVEQHEWLASGAPDAGAVLDRPEVAIALLVFLRATGSLLPEGLLALLEVESHDLPPLSLRWWDVLLREYLFGSGWDAPSTHRDELASRLRAAGLLWRRELRVVESRPVEGALAMAPEKIEACVEICREERSLRGDAMRFVVLTDYIRDGDADEPGAMAEPRIVAGRDDLELGAWPIFSRLVAEADEGDEDQYALVTGRRVILHEHRVALLEECLSRQGSRRAGGERPTRVEWAPLRPGSRWMRAVGVSGSRLVAGFTELMSRGDIRVMVGTRALLGEGWDAPSVNSLVLASFVGAFVGTNQMRGRALRTDPSDPDKVASVWHIMAAAPATRSGDSDRDAFEERCKTFVGLSHEGHVIESGAARLALPPTRSRDDVAAFNREMSRRRESVSDWAAPAWRAAIERGASGQVVPTVRVQPRPGLRRVTFDRTLGALVFQGMTASVFALGEGLVRLPWAGEPGFFGRSIGLMAGVVFLAALPNLGRALLIAARHAPVAGSVRSIALALLDALRELGLIKEDHSGLEVHVEREANGAAMISLTGGTFHEQSLFADSLGEILAPIENPRYLISRRARGPLRVRTDLHAVPSVLGTKKKRAVALLDSWRRHVGPAELVYTREAGGRSALLTARARSLSAALAPPDERMDRWQ